MGRKESEKRSEIFSFHDLETGFDEALNGIIRRFIDNQRETMLPPENVISYAHGEGWMASNSEEENQNRKFELHSHEETIKFQDVVDHKIEILSAFILKMVEGVHSDFVKSIYATVHEASERSGNVVDAAQFSSSADAFLESLRTIEFGVDREGAVSRPEFHVSPKAYEKFVEDIEAAGTEFKKIVEELIADKERVALEREAERKARFAKPNGLQ